VIILVVPKETSRDGQGHVRVEVGYGAEGFITDSRAASFRDEAIPYFRNRDYGDAIALITERVAERYASEYQFQLDSTSGVVAPARAPPARSSRGGGIPPIVYFIILFVILSALCGGRRRGCGGCIPIFIPMGGFGGRRGGWGGGGWGGGGFGG